MDSVIWPFEDRVRIIKGFVPIEQPIFDNADEDTFRFNMWGLYYRVCEAIKSYVVLYEANRIFDAFIIAGHALETCAILSYIKDNPTEEQKKEKYNLYFASILIGQITANLELSDNLEQDISWQSFCLLLQMFYPIGKNILNKNKDYEDVIKQINYRKGPNKEKLYYLEGIFLQLKFLNILNPFLIIFQTLMMGNFNFFIPNTAALNTVICLHPELLLSLNTNMKIVLKNIH